MSSLSVDGGGERGALILVILNLIVLMSREGRYVR